MSELKETKKMNITDADQSLLSAYRDESHSVFCRFKGPKRLAQGTRLQLLEYQLTNKQLMFEKYISLICKLFTLN